MKPVLILFAAMLIILCSFASATSLLTTDTGLMTYNILQDASGDLVDTKDNGLPQTDFDYNGAGYETACEVGTCLYFDGANDIANSSMLWDLLYGTDDYTIAFYLETTDASGYIYTAAFSSGNIYGDRSVHADAVVYHTAYDGAGGSVTAHTGYQRAVYWGFYGMNSTHIYTYFNETLEGSGARGSGANWAVVGGCVNLGADDIECDGTGATFLAGNLAYFSVWNRSLSPEERTEYIANQVQAPSDSCTPPATGNYAVDCSDACSWDSDDEIPANVTMSGSGDVNLKAAWTFTGSNQHINVESGCEFAIHSGGSIG